jgi:hypothetical protein
MSMGEKPAVMPWRAATKPTAQNNAAPVPQAMPAAAMPGAGTVEPDFKRFLSCRP